MPQPISLTEQCSQLRQGTRTSTELVRACLERIADRDPALRAVLGIAPDALTQAARADRRLRRGRPRSVLDGIPVLLKDCIDTAGLLSTSGSRLLAATSPGHDAAVVSALRRAGAIILGKTNLSEWSGFRSQHMIEGWSSLGGQTRHADDPARSPWGSSSGSAVAVAAGMAPLAFGTETDGSIVGPAGQNGVAAIKPEHGLLPLAGVAGISRKQDTIGPFAATLADAVLAMRALCPDRVAPVRGHDLAGLRIGAWLPGRSSAGVRGVFASWIADLRRAGADITEVNFDDQEQLWPAEMRALLAEFEPSLSGYLSRRGGLPSSLAELVAGNAGRTDILQYFGQETFEDALRLDPAELRRGQRTRPQLTETACTRLDAVRAAARVPVILTPANEPAWIIDHVVGDPRTVATSSMAAIAGRPNVCLPLGRVDRLPVGACMFGPPTLNGLLGTALSVEAAIRPCAVS
ncbi:amidase family protein [Micromonospora rifamycinica]|uniref:Amidase n=1 Tax=Micromonospora rifamycinica TaxID=291594 RepID=A0A1C5KG99_9ACTN|nr:amidase family protein [Micromonospora rifamycinica]SCG81617.1 amidase [Micromonospora rifamycinica]